LFLILPAVASINDFLLSEHETLKREAFGALVIFPKCSASGAFGAKVVLLVVVLAILLIWVLLLL
jgi:hypothetical protein